MTNISLFYILFIKRLTYNYVSGNRGYAMVTIKMIAERCGLSVAAVSKALNGQPGIGEARAVEVRQVAQEMGYIPNAAARTLRMHRSYNIGVIFKDSLSHEYFAEVLEAIREEAEKNHYDITFLTNHLLEGMGYYEHARQRQCDGVIIVQGDFSADSVRTLIDSDLAVVSIDHIYDGHTAIISDNVTSTQDLVHALHAMGHTRIAFIHGQPGSITRQRLAGFYRGCTECGIDVPEEYVRKGHYHDADYAGEVTGELLSLEERPTCILYPDDVSYLGGRLAIEAQGLSIPEDISCVGYDGIRLSKYVIPRLTTFRQDVQKIGSMAVRELIQAIEEPKTYASHVISVAGHIQEGATVARLATLSE